MEQRIGRIDRVRSQTDRRLSGQPSAPKGDELLQVYYPHLEDTVEDALPAIHDGAPSGALAPSGMDADDFRVAEPYAFHVLDIESFERAVEGDRKSVV